MIACSTRARGEESLANARCAIFVHSGRSAKTPDCFLCQRRRDDNKNKFFAFEGRGLGGKREKSSKNACLRGKRHDNKTLKVQILLSRNFVVIAQAPTLNDMGSPLLCGGTFEWSSSGPPLLAFAISEMF